MRKLALILLTGIALAGCVDQDQYDALRQDYEREQNRTKNLTIGTVLLGLAAGIMLLVGAAAGSTAKKDAG